MLQCRYRVSETTDLKLLRTAMPG